MDRRSGKFVLTIVILQVFILPDQQVYSINVEDNRREYVQLQILSTHCWRNRGKDFVIAHESADPDVVATALLRGAFEFQGQKCSAASRAYIPSNIAEEVKKKLVDGVNSFKMGSVEDFSNFINAVIDEKSFDKITDYIENANKDANAEISCWRKV